MAAPPANGAFESAAALSGGLPIVEGVHAGCDGSTTIAGLVRSGSMLLRTAAGTLDFPDPPAESLGPYFVARIGSGGQALWAKTIPRGQQAVTRTGPHVTTLPDGSAVTAMSFGTFVTVGFGEPNETTLRGADGDAIVVRHAPDGSLAWVKQLGIAGTFVRAVAAGIDGESHVALDISLEGVLGAGEIDFPVGGARSLTVATMDREGRFTRAIAMSGTWSGDVALAPLPGGGVAMTAGGGGDLTLGEGTPDAVTVTASPGHSLVHAILGPALEVESARLLAVGGFLLSFYQPFPDGSLVMGGSFPDGVTFNEGEASEVRFTKSNMDSAMSEGFVARFDAEGNFVWAKHVAGTLGATADVRALAGTPDGSIWIGGAIDNPSRQPGSAVIGVGSGSPTEIPFPTGFHSFVARLTAGGDVTWTKTLTGGGMTTLDRVSAGRNGATAVGEFDGTLNVGGTAVPGISDGMEFATFAVKLGP
jgi:hypothetical protein